MSRLEVIYLMNVALHLPTMKDVKCFEQVSKQTGNALQRLHVNPWMDCGRDIEEFCEVFQPDTCNCNYQCVNNKVLKEAEKIRNIAINVSFSDCVMVNSTSIISRGDIGQPRRYFAPPGMSPNKISPKILEKCDTILISHFQQYNQNMMMGMNQQQMMITEDVEGVEYPEGITPQERARLNATKRRENFMQQLLPVFTSNSKIEFANFNAFVAFDTEFMKMTDAKKHYPKEVIVCQPNDLNELRRNVKTMEGKNIKLFISLMGNQNMEDMNVIIDELDADIFTNSYWRGISPRVKIIPTLFNDMNNYGMNVNGIKQEQKTSVVIDYKVFYNEQDRRNVTKIIEKCGNDSVKIMKIKRAMRNQMNQFGQPQQFGLINQFGQPPQMVQEDEEEQAITEQIQLPHSVKKLTFILQYFHHMIRNNDFQESLQFPFDISGIEHLTITNTHGNQLKMDLHYFRKLKTVQLIGIKLENNERKRVWGKQQTNDDIFEEVENLYLQNCCLDTFGRLRKIKRMVIQNCFSDQSRQMEILEIESGELEILSYQNNCDSHVKFNVNHERGFRLQNCHNISIEMSIKGGKLEMNNCSNLIFNNQKVFGQINELVLMNCNSFNIIEEMKELRKLEIISSNSTIMKGCKKLKELNLQNASNCIIEEELPELEKLKLSNSSSVKLKLTSHVIQKPELNGCKNCKIELLVDTLEIAEFNSMNSSDIIIWIQKEGDYETKIKNSTSSNIKFMFEGNMKLKLENSKKIGLNEKVIYQQLELNDSNVITEGLQVKNLTLKRINNSSSIALEEVEEITFQEINQYEIRSTFDKCKKMKIERCEDCIFGIDGTVEMDELQVIGNERCEIAGDFSSIKNVVARRNVECNMDLMQEKVDEETEIVDLSEMDDDVTIETEKSNILIRNGKGIKCTVKNDYVNKLRMENCSNVVLTCNIYRMNELEIENCTIKNSSIAKQTILQGGYSNQAKKIELTNAKKITIRKSNIDCFLVSSSDEIEIVESKINFGNNHCVFVNGPSNQTKKSSIKRFFVKDSFVTGQIQYFTNSFGQHPIPIEELIIENSYVNQQFGQMMQPTKGYVTIVQSVKNITLQKMTNNINFRMTNLVENVYINDCHDISIQWISNGLKIKMLKFDECSDLDLQQILRSIQTFSRIEFINSNNIDLNSDVVGVKCRIVKCNNVRIVDSSRKVEVVESTNVEISNVVDPNRVQQNANNQQIGFGMGNFGNNDDGYIEDEYYDEEYDEDEYYEDDYYDDGIF